MLQRVIDVKMLRILLFTLFTGAVTVNGQSNGEHNCSAVFTALRKAPFLQALCMLRQIRLSVCLSVCLFVILRYCVKTRNAEGSGLHRRVVYSLLTPRMVDGDDPV